MLRTSGLVLCLLLALGALAEGAAVRFVVSPPEGTPPTAKLFIAGNHRALGDWNAAGVELTRDDAGRYAATVELPVGTAIEFKITRGSWETVEKTLTGEEVDNRTHTVEGNEVVQINVERWADGGAIAAPRGNDRNAVRTGDLRVHDDVASTVLGNRRRVWVWLPPGYDANPETRYPVFYLHDGQNLFDASTSFAGEWHADETAHRLVTEGKIRPVILVGIDNAGVERINEYTATRSEELADGGRGEQYAKFLVTELKPFIDKTYRTRPEREHTAVGGSSLGGLISLYIVRQHNDTFSQAAVISPSLWWNNSAELKAIAASDAWIQQSRLWVDLGDAESDEAGNVRNLTAVKLLHAILMQAKRQEGKDYIVKIVPGGQHNEPAWAARFEDILRFLFPPEPKPAPEPAAPDRRNRR